MSIEDKVTEMDAAMDEAADSINAAARAKRGTTKEADVTSLLSGRDEAGVVTDMNQPLADHIADKKAHGESLLQIDTYSQVEINSRLAFGATVETVPISQFGAPGYLPIGVNGTFEGATAYVDGNAIFASSTLEDDGSMVWIRNGTNGSSKGAYYMYTTNALNGPLGMPVRTNRRYQPPFVPAGKTVQWVGKSSDQIISGALQNAAGVVTEYFLAFTGGTLNAANHQGCFINLAVGKTMFDITAEFFMGNTDFFAIAEIQRGPATSPMEFMVWRITKAQLISGTTIVPELLTNWTTNSFYGLRTAPNIRLTDTERSVNPADNPIVAGPRAMDGSLYMTVFHNGALGTTKSSQRADGLIRSRIVGDIYMADNTSGRAAIQSVSISFTWNPTTKTAAVDPGITMPVNLVAIAGEDPYIMGGATVDSPANYVPGSWPGYAMSMYYHTKGYWYTYANYGIPDSATHVTKGTLNDGPMSMFDALLYSRRTTDNQTVYTNPLFGSAIGGAIAGSTPLPGNRVVVHCTGRSATGITQAGLVLTEKGTAGYTYSSMYSGSFTGYAPHKLRSFLHNMGKTDPTFLSMVSEISNAGDVVCSGLHFIENGPLSVAYNIDADLNISGTVTIPPDALELLRAQIYILSSAPGGRKADFITVIVPRNRSLNAFAVATYISSTNVQYVIAAECSIQGNRSGDITGFTALNVSAAISMSQFTIFFDNTMADTMKNTTGGVVIYEGTDAYFVGSTGKNRAGFIGSDGTYDFRFAIPKSTLHPDWSTFVPGKNTVQYAANLYSALPGVGFGYNSQAGYESDLYTKLVFRLTARNLAEYNAWQQISATVITSQDVAEGWLVYFTQEVPTLINGVYKVMPAETIDLSNIQIFPANTRFYAYLKADPDPRYFVTTVLQEETLDCMLIGDIVTNDTNISNINIERVTRLGIYRISTVPAGSAISVSNGDPAVYAKLLWK